MAIFKIIARVIKKLGKLFSGKKKGTPGPASDRLPGERRIGIYGPSSVGKSVFFTMLYKACQHDREFNLAPDDQTTAAQLLRNLGTLRSGEWLAGTVEESILNFKASLRGGKQFPFSTKDYKGEMVDLEQASAARDDLIEYFQSCDAILFLLSPEMINDPRKCEREIMNFQAMINKVVASGGRGLRIPIGLMITKADDLPGFENDTQTSLVARSADYLKAKSFPSFVEGLCEQYHVKRNIVFQEQVRELLHKLSLFFDYLMTLDMEFQVFFISSVGHVVSEQRPDGQTVTRPQSDPDGIGVKKPFLWVVDTIRRRERIANFNTVRRTVFGLAMVVLLLYSLVYGLHLIPARTSLKDMRQAQRPMTEIDEQLRSYRDSWRTRLVGFFPLPQAHATDFQPDATGLAAANDACNWLVNVSGLRDSTDLEKLSAALQDENRQQRPAWFSRLSDVQQSNVLRVLANAIATHNLNIAMEAERHYCEYGRTSGTVPERVVERCGELLGAVIPVPVRHAQEYKREYQEQLQERMSWIHEILTKGFDERMIRRKWDELSSDEMDLYSGPFDPSRLIAFRDNLRSFEREVESQEIPSLEEIKRAASTRASLLSDFVNAMNPTENLAELRRVRSRSSGHDALGSYIGRILQRLNESAIQDRENAMAADIARWMREGDLFRFLDRGLMDRVSEFSLQGPRRVAQERFRANFRSLERDGKRLQMEVDTVNDNCAVTYWDFNPSVNNFVPSQATRSHSIEVPWYLGKALRIAVVPMSEPDPEYCPKEGRIFELHDQDLSMMNCDDPRTRGILKVRFPEFIDTVRLDLYEPLREAFPQEQ